jgi:ATP-binding cassette subfamily F protein 3
MAIIDDYANWLDQQRTLERKREAEAPALATVPPTAAKPVELSKSALAGRREVEKQVTQLEKQMAGWQGELTLLEQRLADPALYANVAQAQTLTRRQSELSAQLQAAEERWLALQGTLEAAP